MPPGALMAPRRSVIDCFWSSSLTPAARRAPAFSARSGEGHYRAHDRRDQGGGCAQGVGRHPVDEGEGGALSPRSLRDPPLTRKAALHLCSITECREGDGCNGSPTQRLLSQLNS